MLKTLSGAEEYIKLEGNLAQLKEACIKSEIQYLTPEKTIFQVSEQGGLEIPDIICQEGIFLISSQIKELLDSEGIDYIFINRQISSVINMESMKISGLSFRPESIVLIWIKVILIWNGILKKELFRF